VRYSCYKLRLCISFHGNVVTRAGSTCSGSKFGDWRANLGGSIEPENYLRPSTATNFDREFYFGVSGGHWSDRGIHRDMTYTSFLYNYILSAVLFFQMCIPRAWTADKEAAMSLTLVSSLRFACLLGFGVWVRFHGVIIILCNVADINETRVRSTLHSGQLRLSWERGTREIRTVWHLPFSSWGGQGSGCNHLLKTATTW